jgi:hypothetical protein
LSSKGATDFIWYSYEGRWVGASAWQAEITAITGAAACKQHAQHHQSGCVAASRFFRKNLAGVS